MAVYLALGEKRRACRHGIAMAWRIWSAPVVVRRAAREISMRVASWHRENNNGARIRRRQMASPLRIRAIEAYRRHRRSSRGVAASTAVRRES